MAKTAVTSPKFWRLTSNEELGISTRQVCHVSLLIFSDRAVVLEPLAWQLQGRNTAPPLEEAAFIMSMPIDDARPHSAVNSRTVAKYGEVATGQQCK